MKNFHKNIYNIKPNRRWGCSFEKFGENKIYLSNQSLDHSHFFCDGDNGPLKYFTYDSIKSCIED